MNFKECPHHQGITKALGKGACAWTPNRRILQKNATQRRV
jgi:hypothetical protein